MKRSIILTLIALGGTASLASAGPSSPSAMHGRGRLGFAALPISPELRQHLGAPADRGVLVDQVQPDSPAARAGVKVGDIVLDVDSAPATSANDILSALSDRKTGDTVPIVVARGASRVPLTAKLDTDPTPISAMNRDFDGFDRMNGFTFDGSKMLDVMGKLDQIEKRLEKLEKQRPAT
jgi:predicted metalloprotease with PDZ domain